MKVSYKIRYPTEVEACGISKWAHYHAIVKVKPCDVFSVEKGKRIALMKLKLLQLREIEKSIEQKIEESNRELNCLFNKVEGLMKKKNKISKEREGIIKELKEF